MTGQTLTFASRISFTRSCFRQAWQEGLAEATGMAMQVGSSVGSRRARLSLVGLVAGTVALTPATALATTPAGGAQGCSEGATGSIVKLFERIGTLLYIIGGVFALVCFAGAALLFMTSGNKPERAEQGMKWAKNTVIGLALLAGGYFFRGIVVNFVGSSAEVVGGGETGTGANALLAKCGKVG